MSQAAALQWSTWGWSGDNVPISGFYGVDAVPYEVKWDASTGGGFEPTHEGIYVNTAVVPEPTSGLLLLLGMAGLALRRKQA
jgi:hypothetical protein